MTTVYGLTATASGCTVIKSFTVAVLDCVGSSEYSILPPRIYPSPIKDEFKIELTNSATIFIYALDGILIFKKYLGPENNTIQIRDFSPGMYLLKVQGPNEVVTTTIVKSE
jgi:hypothetical protein